MVDWHSYIWVLFKTANTVAVGPHGRTQLLTLLTTQAGGERGVGSHHPFLETSHWALLLKGSATSQ